MKKRKKKSQIETMPPPALLQMLIRQVRNYEQRPAKKHSRFIKTTACEILRMFGYPKKTALDLAKKLIEQDQ